MTPSHALECSVYLLLLRASNAGIQGLAATLVAALAAALSPSRGAASERARRRCRVPVCVCVCAACTLDDHARAARHTLSAGWCSPVAGTPAGSAQLGEGYICMRAL